MGNVPKTDQQNEGALAPEAPSAQPQDPATTASKLPRGVLEARLEAGLADLCGPPARRRQPSARPIWPCSSAGTTARGRRPGESFSPTPTTTGRQRPFCAASAAWQPGRWNQRQTSRKVHVWQSKARSVQSWPMRETGSVLGVPFDAAMRVLENPRLCRQLVKCLWDEDEGVASRAADALETVAAESPRTVARWKDALLGRLVEAGPIKLRWHRGSP